MNLELLDQHISSYVKSTKNKAHEASEHLTERRQRVAFYQDWSKDKMQHMSHQDVYDYISMLFAMLIWGNKQYYVDKIVSDNGLKHLTSGLAEFVWGNESLENRWDTFRDSIKGIGPAMMSEILCYVHPNDCMLWNRRAYAAFNHLGVQGLPRYNYQCTGKKYASLCEVAKTVAKKLESNNIPDPDLVAVDYFLWDELQVEENLSQMFKKEPESSSVESEQKGKSEFIHNEIRDKIAEIGAWLGFDSSTEKKVADGSKVDSIWESTIGNMGRIIYVFEVQTKGSIDSLILNLMKSLYNPAVQGVVAVSDAKQLEKIKKHCETLRELQGKIRYWNYEEVLEVHANLEVVNESINKLNLVPNGYIGEK